MLLSFPHDAVFPCLVTPEGCGARESLSSMAAASAGPFTCRPDSRGLSGTADTPAASPIPLWPTLVRQGPHVPHHTSHVRPAAVISRHCRDHPRQAWRPAAGGPQPAEERVSGRPLNMAGSRGGFFPASPREVGRVAGPPLQFTPWGVCTSFLLCMTEGRLHQHRLPASPPV